MPWTISDIKTRARAAFSANYWTCVAVALLAALFSGNCNFNFRVPFDSFPGETASESGTSASVLPDGDVLEIMQRINARDTGKSAQGVLFPGSGSPGFPVAVPDAGDTPADGISSAVPPPETAATPPTFFSLLKARTADFFSRLDEDDPRALALFGAIVLAVFVAFVVAGLALKFLALNPFAVGCANFFMRNTAEKAPFGAVGAGFAAWKRVVWSMFLRDIFLFLWGFVPIAGGLVFAAILWTTLSSASPPGEMEMPAAAEILCVALLFCLLAIPCWIKTYSYRLVPYLLADDPSLAGRAAIDRSRALMDGHKFHALLLDLSFIGWVLLSLMTCGILFIFWTFPYVQCANAALYRALVPPASLPPPIPPPLPVPPPLPDALSLPEPVP